MRPLLLFLVLVFHLRAQEYGKPDSDAPGDAMIQEYLRRAATRLETNFLGTVKTAQDWQQSREEYRREYFEMLGLWPLPEKTPLHASITHTLDRGDYQVDCVHFQSRPGLYVTGNLYRPAASRSGERLPAILYVCGHSSRGRNGGKAAFQSHGIWFARHGYVCLIIDTLQLGEIAGIHHGTYREGRWWWLSRGYTPAGVECWNGLRAIDYLSTRPDVDPERIGVTGISGGGAATFWITAADDRVKVAVPVSGMADLTSYVGNRVVNGHCDCMFLYNAYQWPWTRIAGLVAPRPLLFTNSDEDSIFPMDANERVINRLEHLYSLFGASDRVDAFVSVGGHDYRQDIRQAAFRFLNIYLKGDPRPIEDSEVDLVTGGREPIHPIPPEQLRVFATDSDIPSDAQNAKIDETFVPIGRYDDPQQHAPEILAGLRRLTFRHFPEQIPPATEITKNAATNEGEATVLRTEDNITVRLQSPREIPANAEQVIVQVGDLSSSPLLAPDALARRRAFLLRLEPRGVGASRWTTRNPPNYVERAHYLLGRTVDSGRIWDIIATTRYLKAKYPNAKVAVAGERESAVLAVYAALLEPDIAEAMVKQIPSSLMEPHAPALLNAMRVCDLPEVLKVLTPRKVTTL